MINTSLALRYARAFYKIALSINKAPRITKELLDFCDILERNQLLKRAIYHPNITFEEKYKIISILFNKHLEKITINFIKFLINKKRIYYINTIAKCIEKLHEDYENKLSVKIESVYPLQGEILKRIREQLIKSTKKDIIITSQLNPSLIGGIRIILGNQIIDGSISYKLKKLSETINVF